MPPQPEPPTPARKSIRREGVRAAVVRNLYRIGRRVGGRLPPQVIHLVIGLASRIAVRQGGVHMETLRRNLAVMNSSTCDDALLRRATASQLRNIAESLALSGWSTEQITTRVTTVNEQALRTAYAGPGAVVALPHSGNWDLAGAWAALSGMPVTTVAEQLTDADYADFLRFREGLGMEVLSHRDPGAISQLAGAVRRGRLVCLLADRDLPGTGMPVRWAGESVTMPAGPAVIARRTGASLLPAVCQFTPDGMVIIFGEPIQSAPGRDGLVSMTQQVADFFATTIATRPEDWHMLQPFFGLSSAT